MSPNSLYAVLELLIWCCCKGHCDRVQYKRLLRSCSLQWIQVYSFKYSMLAENKTFQCFSKVFEHFWRLLVGVSKSSKIFDDHLNVLKSFWRGYEGPEGLWIFFEDLSDFNNFLVFYSFWWIFAIQTRFDKNSAFH